jgi:hypothetical protein
MTDHRGRHHLQHPFVHFDGTGNEQLLMCHGSLFSSVVD